MIIRKLTASIEQKDLQSQPVWFFPMDESIEDGDLIVEPLINLSRPADDYQIIIKANFIDAEGVCYIGYIYWYSEGDVGSFQPSLFIGEDSVNFWHGVRKPDDKQLSIARKINFPVTFESEEHIGLQTVSGILDGLYYYDDLFNMESIK